MLRIASVSLVLLTALMPLAVPAGAQPAPKIQPATDGIFEAFRTHAIVGLGDHHDLAQEEDFFATLVRDPRFARQVGNVVVEFGSAQSQPILDRYLNGEDIPYTELRKVWEDRVGWVPSGARLGYANFFAAVRTANMALPPAQRIRVWLGDPPIDWNAVRTKADWLPILRQRDMHTHALIRREILSKGRKALVIYGGTHFFPSDQGELEDVGPLLNKSDPGALFTVLPYSGFTTAACSLAFEKDARLPLLSLATPVRGTSLEKALTRPGCRTSPDSISPKHEGQWSGTDADAFLYIGPAAGLLRSPLMPDIYLDAAHRAEMSRRYEIVMGKPLASSTYDRNPSTALPFRP